MFAPLLGGRCKPPSVVAVGHPVADWFLVGDKRPVEAGLGVGGDLTNVPLWEPIKYNLVKYRALLILNLICIAMYNQE